MTPAVARRSIGHVAVRMRTHLDAVLTELSTEPAPFRVRAYAHGHQFADTYDAWLVW